MEGHSGQKWAVININIRNDKDMYMNDLLALTNDLFTLVNDLLELMSVLSNQY